MTKLLMTLRDQTLTIKKKKSFANIISNRCHVFSCNKLVNMDDKWFIMLGIMFVIHIIIQIVYDFY